MCVGNEALHNYFLIKYVLSIVSKLREPGHFYFKPWNYAWILKLNSLFPLFPNKTVTFLHIVSFLCLMNVPLFFTCFIPKGNLGSSISFVASMLFNLVTNF